MRAFAPKPIPTTDRFFRKEAEVQIFAHYFIILEVRPPEEQVRFFFLSSVGAFDEVVKTNAEPYTQFTIIVGTKLAVKPPDGEEVFPLKLDELHRGQTGIVPNEDGEITNEFADSRSVCH